MMRKKENEVKGGTEFTLLQRGKNTAHGCAERWRAVHHNNYLNYIVLIIVCLHTTAQHWNLLQKLSKCLKETNTYNL